jgi:hypothetical protein
MLGGAALGLRLSTMINLFFLQSISGRKASTSWKIVTKRTLAPRPKHVLNHPCSPHITAFEFRLKHLRMQSPQLIPFSLGITGVSSPNRGSASERWVFWVGSLGILGGGTGVCVGGGVRLILPFEVRMSRLRWQEGVDSQWFRNTHSYFTVHLLGCKTWT